MYPQAGGTRPTVLSGLTMPVRFSFSSPHYPPFYLVIAARCINLTMPSTIHEPRLWSTIEASDYCNHTGASGAAEQAAERDAPRPRGGQDVRTNQPASWRT